MNKLDYSLTQRVIAGAICRNDSKLERIFKEQLQKKCGIEFKDRAQFITFLKNRCERRIIDNINCLIADGVVILSFAEPRTSGIEHNADGSFSMNAYREIYIFKHYL